jgi:hypothetical protein
MMAVMEEDCMVVLGAEVSIGRGKEGCQSPGGPSRGGQARLPEREFTAETPFDSAQGELRARRERRGRGSVIPP